MTGNHISFVTAIEVYDIYMCSFNLCVCYTTIIVTMRYNCNWVIGSWGNFGGIWVDEVLINSAKQNQVNHTMINSNFHATLTYTVHCYILVLIASSTYLLYYQSYSVMYCVMSTMLVRLACAKLSCLPQWFAQLSFPQSICEWIFCICVSFNVVTCAVTYAYWLCEKCYCGDIELGKSR